MVQAIPASSSTLFEVIEKFQFKNTFEDEFESFLKLEPLTEIEKAAALDLQKVWQNYRLQDRTAEHYVKTAGASFLMWSCGYVTAGLELLLEEDIEEIELEDGDTVIRGRMDMMMWRPPQGQKTALCPLIIENKKGGADTTVGVPQLLTYASTFLKYQPMVWGLVTNGYRYAFFQVQEGLFREFRPLYLFSPKDLEMLFQVAIAIRRLAVT